MGQAHGDGKKLRRVRRFTEKKEKKTGQRGAISPKRVEKEGGLARLGHTRVQKAETCLHLWFFREREKKKKRKMEAPPSHELAVTTFTSPTLCIVCKKLLWGLKNQGLSCTRCRKPVHKNCKGSMSAHSCPNIDAADTASTAAATEAPLRHEFRIHSWTRPAYCNVCHGLLVGLTRQGLRCDMCGCQAHRKCVQRAMVAVGCGTTPRESVEQESEKKQVMTVVDMEVMLQLQQQGVPDDEAVAALQALADCGLPQNVKTALEVVARRKARGAAVSLVDESEDDDSLCCVCLERPKSALLLPCKHLCLCSHCKLQECPMCRTAVEQRYDDIFL